MRFLIKMLIQGYRVSFIATMTHFTSKFAAFRGNCWLEFMRKAVPQHSTSIGKSSLWIVGDGRTANFFLEFFTQYEVISFRCISRDWRYSWVNPYRGLHIIIDMATSLWWVSFARDHKLFVISWFSPAECLKQLVNIVLIASVHIIKSGLRGFEVQSVVFHIGRCRSCLKNNAAIIKSVSQINWKIYLRGGGGGWSFKSG